ncbi:hypothetical protein IQ07DRAFT_644183 [Pyrenochaeta sp. DS3sAY3a]|nr:hypothetical protein IQ07DRAFT_644183 [Pyrenochaeta sp. DS3sAY3a]
MSEIQYGSLARQTESKGPTIYALSISFVALSCASVILRLYTRKSILRIWGSDDIAIVIAQILSFSVTITTILQVALGGLGRHTEFITQDAFVAGAKGMYSNLLVYNAAQIVTKVSFLIQYRRLFPSHTIQKICTSGLVFLGIWGVAQQLITAFSCVPLELLIPKWHGRCIPTFSVFNLNSVMNMVTDFAIFAIPIRPVLHLQMPRRRKLHLLAVFCLGFFACAISIVRLIELHRTNGTKDPLWDSAATAYWSAIELNVGILCACIPTLRPLVKKFAPRLIGSTARETLYAHQFGSVQTKRSKINETGIYVQKEIEFQSTTELRSKEAMKNPFSIRGESVDEIIIEGADVTNSAKGER